MLLNHVALCGHTALYMQVVMGFICSTVNTVRQFGHQNFCGLLKIALVSKFQ